MEPSGHRGETEHEPVAANPFRGTPPWQRGGSGWKRTLGGIGALVITIGSVAGVTWLAFRDNGDGGAGAADVIYERCQVTEADDAQPVVEAPRLDTPAERSIATIETSYGNLDVMLWGDVAPCGVAAFSHLATAGYYNSDNCDRLTTQAASPTAILHCGSPGRYEAGEETEETYGPGWRFAAETGMAGNDVQDVLALVTDESGNAGSAFTLIRGAAEPTPGVSVVGGIVDGYEVLDTIAALTEEVESDGPPPVPVTIFGVTITPIEDLPGGDTVPDPTDPGTSTQTPGPSTDPTATDAPSGTESPNGTETTGGFNIETIDPTATQS
ncbi:peptidylprolyl isomerase [Glycomyces buryatensis]|nr:peptidylprolyl isomerase [Glycomyces buryatensis]